MFVVACKYTSTCNFILNLVDDIRKFHSEEEIVVIDSDSEDKSYFKLIEKYGVIIEDIKNHQWHVGAYWHAFNKYPDYPFYYFMNDSMRVKTNLDHLKSSDLTILAYFSRTANKSFNSWADRVNSETCYNYKFEGKGCYGPIFFCKNELMKKLKNKGIHKLLPCNKAETGYCEGLYGFCFESEGYDLTRCSLFGDILELEKIGGKTGPYPHNTSWQFPVEKFYGSHRDKKRK